MPYRYSGISADLADEARRTHKSPQYGHPAHQEVAGGTGPCRLCLRTFAVGQEQRLLFTYQPFLEPDALPAPGPIFVHADGCERYDSTELPPDFRFLPTVVEGYGAGGRLLAQVRVAAEPTDVTVEQIFHRPEVAYVHLRNGEAGCFMARIERLTTPGDTAIG